MTDEFLPDPQYKFLIGLGDMEHETRLTDAAAKGYRVQLMTHNPGGQLVVLMAKDGETKKRS
jgi:hypothetical protein